MNLLIHVEQYDKVGILPSQLESIRLLADSVGCERIAYVDATVDGISREHGFERFGSLAAWLDQVGDAPIIAFTSDQTVDVRDLEFSPDAWLVFGPAMGLTKDSFGEHEVTWGYIPVAMLNSRDAVPIVLWETIR